ncbi:alpha/beta-hydrolase, partial [Aureobasidium melanogenum]
MDEWGAPATVAAAISRLLMHRIWRQEGSHRHYGASSQSCESISNSAAGSAIDLDGLAYDASDILSRPNAAHRGEAPKPRTSAAESDDHSPLISWTWNDSLTARRRKERSVLNANEITRLPCRGSICIRHTARGEKCDKVIDPPRLIEPMATGPVRPTCHLRAEMLQNLPHGLSIVYRDDFVVLVVFWGNWCAAKSFAFDFIMKWQPSAEAQISTNLQTASKQTVYGDCSSLTDPTQEDMI